MTPTLKYFEIKFIKDGLELNQDPPAVQEQGPVIQVGGDALGARQGGSAREDAARGAWATIA